MGLRHEMPLQSTNLFYRIYSIVPQVLRLQDPLGGGPGRRHRPPAGEEGGEGPGAGQQDRVRTL